MVDLTNFDNIKEFNSIFGIITSISQMIGPLVASIIVSSFNELVGYSILFSYGISMLLTVNTMNIIGQNLAQVIYKDANSILELTCLREVFVGIGRITSTILLVVIYKIAGDFSYLWIFGIIAIVLSLSSIRDINFRR